MVPQNWGITGIRTWDSTFESSKLTYSRMVRGQRKMIEKCNSIPHLIPSSIYLLHFLCCFVSIVGIPPTQKPGLENLESFFIVSCLSLSTPMYLQLMNSQVLSIPPLRHWCFSHTTNALVMHFFHQEAMPHISLYLFVSPCPATELITSPPCSKFVNGSPLPKRQDSKKVREFLGK